LPAFVVAAVGADVVRQDCFVAMRALGSRYAFKGKMRGAAALMRGCPSMAWETHSVKNSKSEALHLQF